MKIEENYLLEKSGDFQEKSFTINASSKAFSILSKNIYTNVPLAIIRELSANAYDSHKEAGKEHIPFEVHLPTYLEPFFSITDFGVGLSPEQIEQIYTSYFTSTKTNTNELIGGLGLGSKSPFALVDQFTVVSKYNGVKYTYTAYKSDKGVPTIALMGSEETTDCNGVCVSLAVDNSLHSTFGIEAYNLYKYFYVPPEINTQSSIDSSIKGKELFSGTTNNGFKYKLVEGTNSSYSTTRGIIIVMGQIPYNINININVGDIRKAKADVVIYVNIGDFEVTASRESISYTEKDILKVTAWYREITEAAYHVFKDNTTDDPNSSEWERFHTKSKENDNYTKIFFGKQQTYYFRIDPKYGACYQITNYSRVKFNTIVSFYTTDKTKIPTIIYKDTSGMANSAEKYALAKFSDLTKGEILLFANSTLSGENPTDFYKKLFGTAPILLSDLVKLHKMEKKKYIREQVNVLRNGVFVKEKKDKTANYLYVHSTVRKLIGETFYVGGNALTLSTLSAIASSIKGAQIVLARKDFIYEKKLPTLASYIEEQVLKFGLIMTNEHFDALTKPIVFIPKTLFNGTPIEPLLKKHKETYEAIDDLIKALHTNNLLKVMDFDNTPLYTKNKFSELDISETIKKYFPLLQYVSLPSMDNPHSREYIKLIMDSKHNEKENYAT